MKEEAGDFIVLEGEVLENLPNTLFRVKVSNSKNNTVLFVGENEEELY